MPHEAKPEVQHRQVAYRFLFDIQATARRLAAVAGACRFVWNRMPDRQQLLLDDARLNGEAPPAPIFFAPGREFTRLRWVTPWLREMPCAPVRRAHRYQANAWQWFLEDETGRPRFRRRGTDSVTIPQDVRIRDDSLHFPRLGWLTARVGVAGLPTGWRRRWCSGARAKSGWPRSATRS